MNPFSLGDSNSSYRLQSGAIIEDYESCCDAKFSTLILIILGTSRQENMSLSMFFTDRLNNVMFLLKGPILSHLKAVGV